ncbi:MAG: ribbon-helix-helix protein, CopG family [Burkholderiales bacterium]
MARTTLRFTISLSPELTKQLNEIAKREYRTRSAVIQMLIRTHTKEDHRPDEVETVAR